MKNPLDRLKENISSLPRSQKLVVDFILSHYNDVGFMTVEELSKKVGTSTTTVMRLMSSVGFSGYSEFQKNLQLLLKEESTPHTRLEKNLTTFSQNERWLNHYDLQLAQIQQANQINMETNLSQVESIIKKATNVFCTSVRSGLPVAQYLAHNLNRMFGNTKLTLADSSDWVDDVISFSKEDVLIVVSFARYGARLMHYADQARKNGASVVVITDKFSSPLLAYADAHLICPAESISSHNSVVSSFFLVDYLISALALSDSERVKQRLSEVNNVLTSMNYHIEKKNN
ncbi:MurR/RpiR family transcriptional regulator [Shouchella lehensis]|uniref:HTH-type transcriptional regulator n=2 Tax=Shouchella lehensis TaxID=300825 RepID=A0A060M645_9BACI|nr:MurR/RpiR family transcriptional regulator [Shouchella lehensis]AIC96013.1 HTH-type transcriptional regulator [Shouchella lehensis G1]MBG9784956.1 transcriptional regulator [Shouchella lehensis]TES46376.1 MurR/RpiR family transcriptional regulator [Shouchella lehensis]